MINIINFVKGIVENVSENYVVLETGGIGYQIFVSQATISRLPNASETVKMYTYMSVKEDGISLYGFLSMEEIDMFNLLISVSGIGPKVALATLSAITPRELMIAIITDDLQTLGKAPGVGKKTAQRLVLELKDKIKTDDAVSSMMNKQQSISKTGQQSSVKQDAIDALIALGYTRSVAVKGVLEVAVDGLTTEQIIKLVLKKVSM